jgi:hypothetical protein
MKCKEVQSALIDFVDGKLDKDFQYDMGKHLETCEKCNQDFLDLKKMLSVISDSPMQEPGPELRENFKTMLQSEINILATTRIIKEEPVPGTIRMNWSSPWFRIAAAFIILALGVLIGSKWSPGSSANSSEMSTLRNEVKEMKEVLMVNLLKEESASERIKAVSYVEGMTNPDQKIISVLLTTLNNDKNVNVRLASLYSLAKFSDRQSVRDSLVESLTKQSEPIIQIVLINLLAEKKESKAVKPIQDIIRNQKTLKEVKDIAEKSLRSI